MAVATPAAVDTAVTPQHDIATARGPVADHHELWRSVLLHLAPGALFGLFIVATVPLLERWNVDPLFALFGGIALVPVPFELGYLAFQSRRTTGSWSPLAAVSYRERLPWRQTAKIAAALAVWFVVSLAVWVTFAEQWVADNVFGWLPSAITNYADMEGAAPTGTALVLLLAIAFAFNGLLGPVTEELYFRGHLLPRLEHYGNKAPVIGTLLFALYHVWTPWRWPVIAVGFLPTAWQVHKRRSVRLGIAAHVTINVLFLLMFASTALS